MSPALVVVIVVVLVLLYLVVVYNGLIRRRVRVDSAWSQIDVQLQRRHDLIPNLVETVKGYAGHERDLFEHVAEARSQALSATGVQGRGQAEQQVSGALRQLMAV